jgi:hypothetical protein
MESGSWYLRFHLYSGLMILFCQMSYHKRKQQVLDMWENDSGCSVPGSPDGQVWIYDMNIHTEYWKDFYSLGSK